MKNNFKFLTGDVNWLQYGAKWISGKKNNGDFDYYFVIEIMNWIKSTGGLGPDETKYNINVHAVSPAQAGEENVKKALDCCGFPECELTDEIKVEALLSYGIATPIEGLNCNNAHKGLAELKKKSQMFEMMFGFYMDRSVNRIGTSGWESVKGDITAGLARTIASGTLEGKILGKMHGIEA